MHDNQISPGTGIHHPQPGSHRRTAPIRFPLTKHCLFHVLSRITGKIRFLSSDRLSNYHAHTSFILHLQRFSIAASVDIIHESSRKIQRESEMHSMFFKDMLLLFTGSRKHSLFTGYP